MFRKGRILKLAEGPKEQEEQKNQAFRNSPSHRLVLQTPQFYRAPASTMITILATSQPVHTWLKLNQKHLTPWAHQTSANLALLMLALTHK